MCGNIEIKASFLCAVQISVAAHFLLREKSGKEHNKMPDYESMYYQLFNKITDVISELKDAQLQAEELYINSASEETDEK